jgi:hypothetical protein
VAYTGTHKGQPGKKKHEVRNEDRKKNKKGYRKE